MAAIRFVSGQLSAGGAGAGAAALPDPDDHDIAQLGTSFRDPRRIVSTRPRTATHSHVQPASCEEFVAEKARMELK